MKLLFTNEKPVAPRLPLLTVGLRKGAGLRPTFLNRVPLRAGCTFSLWSNRDFSFCHPIFTSRQSEAS